MEADEKPISRQTQNFGLVSQLVENNFRNQGLTFLHLRFIRPSALSEFAPSQVAGNG